MKAWRVLSGVMWTPLCLAAAEPMPPAGFRAIFNGKDLAGWHGLNPHAVGKLEGEKLAANWQQQRDEFPEHWSVENGELVNVGTGPYATTDEEFGDIEFLIEYQTVAPGRQRHLPAGQPAGADLGHHPGGGQMGPERRQGLGGLFNNTKGAPGQLPLVHADKPFGEWNAFRIKQAGSHTWVWLNDQLVVDGAVMENFWDRSQPMAAKGPSMLQTHGGEIRWRNVFVREIPADEAQTLLKSAAKTN